MFCHIGFFPSSILILLHVPFKLLRTIPFPGLGHAMVLLSWAIVSSMEFTLQTPHGLIPLHAWSEQCFKDTFATSLRTLTRQENTCWSYA